MTPAQAFLASVRQSLGESVVCERTKERQLMSEDIFTESPVVASAVLRPGSETDVQRIVEMAAKHRVQLRVRGSGLSYTSGYTPSRDDDVVVDMCGLARVVAIDETNLTATVEAGCTWQTLLSKLQPKNLECVVTPPVSGSHSTIGGAVAQGLPGDMSWVVSVTVVLGSGDLLTTGSSGTTPGEVVFNRHAGPDLTGLFIGDCGAMGIKTRVAVRLRERLPFARHACFLFRSLEDLVGAAAGTGRAGVAQRVLGLDPSRARSLRPATLGEAAMIGRELIAGGGLTNTLRLAVGSLRKPPSDTWSLHCTTVGETQHIADDRMAIIRRHCRHAVAESAATVARGLSAQPFSVRGIAGRNGEAWVPVHGIVPVSRCHEAALELSRFMAERHDEMAARQVTMSLLISANGPHVLFEPMFLWPDSLAPVTRQVLGESRVRRFPETPAAPDNRDYVRTLREELRKLFVAHDATFVQLGRFYPLSSQPTNAVEVCLTRLRRTVDPSSVVNPEILGLDCNSPTDCGDD